MDTSPNQALLPAASRRRQEGAYLPDLPTLHPESIWGSKYGLKQIGKYLKECANSSEFPKNSTGRFVCFTDYGHKQFEKLSKDIREYENKSPMMPKGDQLELAQKAIGHQERKSSFGTLDRSAFNKMEMETRL